MTQLQRWINGHLGACVSLCCFPVQFNPETTRLAFLYRFGHCFHKADPGVWTFLFTVATDGTGLWRVPVVQGGAGHDYGGNGRLLVCDPSGVFEVEDRRHVTKLQLPESGALPVAPGLQ